MRSKLINVLMFAAGAAIGSAVTWKIVRDRYEKMVQEEITSIKEAFANRNSIEPVDTEESSEDEEEETPHDSTKQINWEELEDLEDEDDDESNSLTHRYSSLTSQYKSEEGGAAGVGTRPYVISPYEFGEVDDYNQFELTYYADGILEDEDYNIVDDVDYLIGEESLETFGEYEDDAVFVRNDKLRSDFQILRDIRTYEEARGTSPNMVYNG